MTDDIATCQSIRRVVFIEEQKVSLEDEVDGKDEECRHYLGFVNDVPVATGRVLKLGRNAKIQRVAVLGEHRCAGLGLALMRFILLDLRPEFETAVLGAQTHAIGFYEQLGFEAFGAEYDDAGIPHRDMRIALR